MERYEMNGAIRTRQSIVTGKNCDGRRQKAKDMSEVAPRVRNT